jgi:hypothetical protein
MYAGGFAGRIGYGGNTVTVERCYAKGSVSALGYSTQRMGGFAGYIVGGSDSNVAYCYATGSVYVMSRGGLPSVGGFAGGTRISVNNCYALGNVFVDKTSVNPIHAGGLIGSIENYSLTVEQCFAAGSVTAQRNLDLVINAGGLVGDNSNLKPITDSAVLGASITATGSIAANRHIGRVVGNDATGASNNHGYIDLMLYQSDTYGAGILTMTPTAGTSNPGGKDGQDAHLGIFRSRSFWGTTLGFSETDWSFTTVEARGYPVLRVSSNGAVMGGQ